MRDALPEQPPPVSLYTASECVSPTDCRNTTTYVPSETTWNGASAVSRAVVDRNGSVSWAVGRSSTAASAPPRLTVGIAVAPTTAYPTSASSRGKTSSAGLSLQ